jgi:hypothetical protein
LKKLLLIICFSGVVIANEPPQVPWRRDSLKRPTGLHLYSASEDIVSQSPALPKSPPMPPMRGKMPEKMVTVSVNVWRNDPCDEELWQKILQEYYKLKNAPFSPSELFAGITAFIKLTEEKKGQALWGGLSFTEVPDSQRIDNKKAPEKP